MFINVEDSIFHTICNLNLNVSVNVLLSTKERYSHVCYFFSDMMVYFHFITIRELSNKDKNKTKCSKLLSFS